MSRDAASVWVWVGLGAILLVHGALSAVYMIDFDNLRIDLFLFAPFSLLPLVMGALTLWGASGLSADRPSSRRLLRYVAWLLLVVPPGSALIGLVGWALARYAHMDDALMFTAWTALFVGSWPFYVAGAVVAASQLLYGRGARKVG